MSLINYNLIRIFFIFVFWILFVFILLYIKKRYYKIYKSKRVIIIIAFIILFIIYRFNPIDALFFKFNSLNQASDFFSPNRKIIKKYEFNDHAYIIYGNHGFHNVIYYKKVNSKWGIGNYKFGRLGHKTIKRNNMVHYLYKTPHGENIIVINRYIINNDDQVQKVKTASDSENNNFDTHFYRCNKRYCYILIDTIVKGNLKEDYTINIGKGKYKLFN